MTKKFYRSVAIWAFGMGVLILAVSLFIRNTQRAVGKLETVELLPQAARAEAAGDLDEARALYDEILGYTPDSRMGRLGAARMAYRQGRFSEALAHCGAALGYGVSDSSFDEQLLRGKLLLAMGRFDEATAAFRSAAASGPDSPEPLSELAKTAEATLDFALLRETLYAVGKLDSADASREYREQRERLRQIIDASGHVIQSAGPTAQTYYALASALRDSGNWDGAMDAFAQATRLPDCPADAWFWLGADAAADGDVDAAAADFQKVLSKLPRHRAALYAAQRYPVPDTQT